MELKPALVETLPLAQRLALAYAPRSARSATLALLAFDSRLGHALRQAHEPIMAQMRLAWWRDQLKLPPPERERSDALVCALDQFEPRIAALQALVDGWELLVSEELSAKTAGAFASSRAQAMLGLARLIGARDDAEAVLLAGQRWALADLASGLASADERAVVLDLAPKDPSTRLSRMMRPLAVLDGLARRSLAAGGTPLLDGRSGALTAIRLGLFGR